jgi:hypothetical protein
MVWLLFGSLAVLLAGVALFWAARRRHVDRWLVPYLLEAPRRRPVGPKEEVHLLLCIADHWEPKVGGAPPEVARARVARWVEDYPRQFARFADSDGRPPRHTFFYPVEEYEPEYLDALAELCAAGLGEVEVHLHHDGDTADNLRATLNGFKELLAGRHGLLSRRWGTGELAYGFIHGNWALCNSRPDGRWCGVNDELTVLRETGCYADFTLPSAPSPTQTSTINKIYYATSTAARPRGHDRGVAVGRGPADGLLLVPGPLMLNWRRRKWGVLPRLENSCLQGSQPAALERLPLWLRARVQVPGRPDWFFVKLHTHGTIEDNFEALLGEPMVAFHRALAALATRQVNFRYHYVTAREMYNLVKAAESGWSGSVADALDYELVANSPTPSPDHLGKVPWGAAR